MIQCFIRYLSVTDTFYHHKINNKEGQQKHHPMVLSQPLDIQDLNLDWYYSSLRAIKENRKSKRVLIEQRVNKISKQGKEELSVQHSLNLIMNRYQTQIEKHSTKWQNSTLPNVSVMTDEGKLWNCSRKRRYIYMPFDQ